MFRFLKNHKDLMESADWVIKGLTRLLCIVCCCFFSVASLADCDSSLVCQGKSESECTAAAGCYWTTSMGGKCVICSVGWYCPANDANSYKCSDLENSDFLVKYTRTGPDGNSEGCSSVNDCVALKNCTLMDDTETDQTSCKIYYHQPQYLWCEGTEYSEYPFVIGNSVTDVHVERDQWQHKCFQNVLNCKVLYGGSAGVNPESYAEYHYTGCGSPASDSEHFWDVELCEYNQTINNFSYTGNIYLEEGTFSFSTHCNAAVRKGIKKNDTPKREYHNGCNGSDYNEYWYTKSATHNVNNQVYSFSELKSYYCNSCKNGYQPSLSAPTNAPCLANVDNGATSYVSYVCECEQIPKGHYGLSNGCSWTGNYWQLTNGSPLDVANLINDCVGSCSFGQTTDSVGSTSVDACHYTADTQFCDARGCFSLSDIQDWSPVP